jgi:energy-coupling factor transporter ATP-binding protein EcfA2
MSYILGFTGKMGSGKTTAANMTGGLVLSYASPLKEVVLQLFDLEWDQLHTQEGKETVDERWEMSPRRILQIFGTDLVRKHFPDLWTYHMEKRIKGTKQGGVYHQYICVDDVRFENEAALIRNLGGTIIHILGRSKSGEGEDHISEQKIERKYGDLLLINDKGFDELEDQVSKIKEFIEG